MVKKRFTPPKRPLPLKDEYTQRQPTRAQMRFKSLGDALGKLDPQQDAQLVRTLGKLGIKVFS